MRRVPPPVLIHEELDRLLAEGVGPEQILISELVETVTRLVVQQLLEGEQTDSLGGQGSYQPRDPEAGQRVSE